MQPAPGLGDVGQLPPLAAMTQNVDRFAALMWGFTDRSSWVPSTFAGQGEALRFDASYQPKPAHTSVNDYLSGR